MANEWNVSYPLDHTLISAVPGEVRKLKDSCKDQLKREHEDPVDGDATGAEHSSGSAVAYEGTATPTNRPDGTTALADNAIDRGRLWLDDNHAIPALKRWNGSAFEVISGAVLQVVNFQTGAVATGSTVIPHDDTIPQKTEGDEYMTLAITPSKATNKLKIDVVVFLCSASGDRRAAALFQDDTASALAVGMAYKGSTESHCIAFTHYMTAGTASETTFKVRAGTETAQTNTFNGHEGTRKYGGVLASSITITEILV